MFRDFINRIVCRVRRHRWRFRCINAEGEKVFYCSRCGRVFIAPKQ